MPFASSRHHEYQTADVRHLDMLDESLLAGGTVYAVMILENHSRAVLASSVTRRQDLNAFLSVLYRVTQEYGPPETFVTDSGSGLPRQPGAGNLQGAWYPQATDREGSALAKLPGNSIQRPA